MRLKIYSRLVFLYLAALGEAVTLAGTRPSIPTKGTFRVLAVFVQFKDDTWDHPCPSDPQKGWPAAKHKIPEWARRDRLLSPRKKNKYRAGSLSDYFAVMSQGKFHFIGDVFPRLYLTPQPFAFYSQKEKRGRGYLTQKIIDWLDANGVDFSRYDNDNDGDVDFIMFLFRHWKPEIFTPGNAYQGISSFGFRKPVVKDGKKILGGFPGSGTMQRGNYTLATCRSIVTHEISHYFFGGGHFSSIGSFGIHDGNAFCYAMSGYERELLRWITPRKVKAGQTFTLQDALTTNDYVRLDMGQGREYFLFENRQKISIFEKGDCVEGSLPAKGLLISRIRPNVSKSRQITWVTADQSFRINDKGEASDTFHAGDEITLAASRSFRGRNNKSQQKISVRILEQKKGRIKVKLRAINPEQKHE